MAYERMANRYSTMKDLSDRLHGTICRYKNVPATVSVVSEKCLMLTDICNGELIAKIKPDDPDFDISSPELGYFNYNESDGDAAIYTARQPYRRFRQGLYQQACNFSTIDGASLRGYYGKTFFSTKGFYNLLIGKFPSVEEAQAILRSDSKIEEIAISPSIALKKTGAGLILVYFRTTNVGWIKPDSNEVEIVVGEFDWVVERYFNRAGLVIKEKVRGYAA